MKQHVALLASVWAGSGWALAVRQQLNSTSVSSAFGTGTATLPSSTVSSPAKPSSTLSSSRKKLIIEVKDASVLNSVGDAIKESDPSAVFVYTWDNSLFPGYSVESALSLLTVSGFDGVQNVWAATQVLPPWEPPSGSPGNGTANGTAPATGALKRSQTSRSKLSPLSKRQEEESPIYQADNYSDTVHRMTGVDRLHEDGVLGAGIKVAVVDDGVYWKHKLLGEGFGPGNKVIGGYDFRSLENGEDEDPEPEHGAGEGFIGHGTHVAGIIAGKSDIFRGVAPEANILAYKVFGRGAVQDDVVIQAFTRAFDDGADVISMSVGGVGAFIDGPVQLLSERLVEQGVVVVVSAGNDGYSGPFLTNNWCAGPSTLCVASVEATHKPADPVEFSFTLDGQTTTALIGHVQAARNNFPLRVSPDRGEWISWMDSMQKYQDIHGKAVPLVYLGDACDAVSANGTDPANTIYFIAQAGCTMEQKVQNLNPLEPRYVLFYADPKQALWMRRDLWPENTVAYGMVEEEAGNAIVSVIEAGGEVTATFNWNEDGLAIPAKNPHGGVASLFTTWGGTYELALKPDIAAPGGDIYSSFVIDSFRLDIGQSVFGPTMHTLNGTSMAAPYIAGVAALYLGKHGGRATNGPGVAREVVNRIKASGIHVPWGMEPYSEAPDYEDPSNPNPVPEGAVAPAMQVGTGIVDAVKVVNYASVIASGGNIALNDTANFQSTHEIVIKNTGPDTLTYTFSHDPQLGLESRPVGTGTDLLANYTNNKVLTLSPEISFPADGSISIPAGGSATATLAFTAPTDGAAVDPSTLPFYNGRVLITSSTNETLAVPYMGAAFDLKAEVPLAWPSQDPPVLNESIDTDKNFSFVWTAPETQNNKAEFVFQTVWGAKFVRLDLFESGTATEDVWSWPPENGASEGWVAAASLEHPLELPVNLYRSHTYRRVNPGAHSFTWWGRTDSGTLEEGKTYKPRFAVLRAFGDPAKAEDWSVWTELGDVQVVTLPPVSALA